MKIEFEKNMMIASELLSYCHLRGAEEYHLDVKQTDRETVFTIKASPARIPEEDMEPLRKKLGAPRQREIEQDFWELSGESESYSELTLVGMMSDDVDIEYDGQTLSITIQRLV